MGFEIAHGPELEDEKYNFEALNIPSDHPARDIHDTFWTTLPHRLLRTHTTNVQAHYLEQKNFPIAMAVLGRCFRHEATDASHDYMFYQCEGLVIDKNISMAHLLGLLETYLKALFGKELATRLRPSYFPFVEPGVEVDITCPFCSNGCSTCKRTGWIELGGAGLVHPNVLRFHGIDPKKWSGCAWGFGLTRLAMLMYGIPDIRLLHESKISFLSLF